MGLLGTLGNMLGTSLGANTLGRWYEDDET